MTAVGERWVSAHATRGIKLHPDGSFSLGSMEFDQSSEFQNTMLDDVIVDKHRGEGQRLFLRAPEATYTYKYENGKWLMLDHAAEPNSGAASATSPSAKPLLLIALASALAVGFFGLLGYVLIMQSRDAPIVQLAPQVAPIDPALEESLRLAKEEEQRRELEAVQRRLNEQERIARTELQAAADDGAKVLRLLSDFGDEVHAWAAIESLLDDERGKTIAADEKHILGFRSAYEATRPTMQDGDVIRTRVELLLDPINKALAENQNLIAPGPELRRKLAEDSTAASGLVTAYRDPRNRIDSILRQATAEGRCATSTLRSAIKDLDHREERERTQKIAEAEEAARKEKDDRLAAEKAQTIRQESEDIAKQLKADREARMKEADAAVIRAKTDAENTRRKALAQSSEVRRLLAPFTAPGVWQPGQRTPNLEKTPVSLTALQKFGALQPNDSGLKKLWYCGNAKARYGTMRVSEDTMRPRWGYGVAFEKLSPNELREIRQAQQYLIDLGDVLVETNMLAP
jgi:hypothetical protein